jgi:hypothetical protein
MEPDNPKEAERQYQQGKREVEEIQAITKAGSAEREQMYREMEQAAYDRGDDD